MRRVMFAVLFAVCFACVSCDESPDLKRQPWLSLHVEYCVGEGPVVEKREWKTEDRELLDQFREAWVEQERIGLWSAGYMRTNRLRVTLASQQQWDLYVYEPTKLRQIHAEDRRRSFSLRVSEAFYHAIRDRIENDTGEKVHFYYRHIVEIVGEED